MRSFRKATPPATIVALERAWAADLEDDPSLVTNIERARGRFDSHDKAASRAAVCAEQTGLCAFCLGRIRPLSPVADKAGTRLAHVIPLRLDPRRIFDWENLVGACPGGTGRALHCDVLQGDRAVWINPAATPSLEQFIRYGSRGELRYEGPALHGRTPAQIQAEFDAVLGLNIERLRANRRAVLDVARLEMERLGWSTANLQREIRRWSTPSDEGFTPYFCVAVSYLQRKLAAQP